MGDLILVQPSITYELQYEAMMNEWEAYGGRLNPGALRRYSKLQQRKVTYVEWLKWIEEDRKAIQDLYFLTNGISILGAISIRTKCVGIHGHIGFGIRPSERKKGYASKMLSMALSIIKNYNINPVVISCDKENIGSAKTILNNGGRLIQELVDACTGNIVQVYYIYLDDQEHEFNKI